MWFARGFVSLVLAWPSYNNLVANFTKMHFLATARASICSPVSPGAALQNVHLRTANGCS